MRGSHVAQTAAIGALFLIGVTALADTRRSAGKKSAAATTDSAKRLVDAGIGFFNAGDFKAAHASFAAARDLAPEKAGPYWMLALTEARLGECDAARRNMDTFRPKVAANDQRLAELASAIESCQAKNTARATPVPPAAAPEPHVGAAVGTTPSEPTRPPNPVTPQRIDAPSPEDDSPVPTTTPPADPRRRMVWGSILMVAGLAVGVGGGVGFGLAADGKAAAIKDEQDHGVRFDPALDDARRLYGPLAYLSWAVGGAVAVTGAVLVILGARGGGATERTAAHITPWASPSGTGLSWNMTF